MSIPAETNFAVAVGRDTKSQPVHAVLLPRKRIGAPSYTLSDADHGLTLIFSSNAAVTLVVPSGLAAGFGCGVVAWGLGDVTPTASGTTIISRPGFTKTAGQGALMYLIAVDHDRFLLAGDGA